MSRHLLIAGTGRAGTSFLVRYLTKLGLETHLSRAGAAASWDETANAGFEDIPLPGVCNLPYVIKSPWTYQFIHELLVNPALQLDAVVVPMRDLTEAAASRCIVELQAMHNTLPWMRELSQTWEHLGHTPGGVVFSTNAVDQARLLAVGFHHLLDQVVKADIPVVLLSFPRLIEDADYLHRKLAAVLPRRVSLDRSRIAHAETADRRKVRVGYEIKSSAGEPEPGFTLFGPGHEHLDRAALQRAFAKLSRDVEGVRTQAAETQRTAQDERNRDLQTFRLIEQNLIDVVKEKDAALSQVAEDLAVLTTTIEEAKHERDRLAADLQTATNALSRMTEEWNQAREALDVAGSALGRAERELDCIHKATTWQMALRFQSLARRMVWAVPIARWLIRPRVRSGLPAVDRLNPATAQTSSADV